VTNLWQGLQQGTASQNSMPISTKDLLIFFGTSMGSSIFEAAFM
jgi:hypothetical protein